MKSFGGVSVAASLPVSRRAGVSVTLPDGAVVVLRHGEVGDVAAVAAMHQRCSPASRYKRYLSGLSAPSRRHLVSLVAPPSGHALVAEVGHGDERRVVALANLMWDGPYAEIGLLVEDAWQGRRLGAALLRRLMRLSRDIGVRAVYLHTQPTNLALIRLVAGLGIPVRREYADGILTLTVHPDAAPVGRLVAS